MITPWEKITEIEGYTFWKYEGEDCGGHPAMVYNVTQDNNPPKNEAGYYSYGYLLKVKGLLPGPTLNELFK